jgi:hypothetical protein
MQLLDCETGLGVRAETESELVGRLDVLVEEDESLGSRLAEVAIDYEKKALFF